MVLAVLTAALAVYSYFEIQTGLPLLTARIPTHSGATAPVSQVLSIEVYFCFILQLLLAVAFWCAAYVAADKIHLGSWSLGRYTPQQQVRILPALRELLGVLALLESVYFAARINMGIREASAHGRLLPPDWMRHLIWTDVEWLAALMILGGIIIYIYLGKFDEVAGEENNASTSAGSGSSKSSGTVN